MGYAMSGIFRDDRGRLRAVPGAFPPLLADFLETDVRENPGHCDRLLANLAEARRGKPFEAYGNLYALAAGADGAVIENGSDETVPPLRLSLDTLEKALTAWRAAMA
jgi:hypothetical protein